MLLRLLCTSWSKSKGNIIRFDSIDQLYDNELCSNTVGKVGTSARGQNPPIRED
jgi:hypothetical protein